MDLTVVNHEATFALHRQTPGITIFRLVLAPDPQHHFAQLVLNHWSALQHLSGDKFLLVAFQRPPEWAETFKSDGKHELGKYFEQTWQPWPGAAADTADIRQRGDSLRSGQHAGSKLN
jgi:hypothetical protein